MRSPQIAGLTFQGMGSVHLTAPGRTPPPPKPCGRTRVLPETAPRGMSWCPHGTVFGSLLGGVPDASLASGSGKPPLGQQGPLGLPDLMHSLFVICCYLPLLHPFIPTFGKSVFLDLLLH